MVCYLHSWHHPQWILACKYTWRNAWCWCSMHHRGSYEVLFHTRLQISKYRLVMRIFFFFTSSTAVLIIYLTALFELKQLRSWSFGSNYYKLWILFVAGSGTRFTRQMQIIKETNVTITNADRITHLKMSFKDLRLFFCFFLTKKTWFQTKNFYFCMTNTL